MTGRFEPDELRGVDQGASAASSSDLAEAFAAAREIERQVAADDVHPSVGFVDSVMARIVAEPRPQPAIAAGAAVRRGRFRAAIRALADTWEVATSGGRPFAVRAQARRSCSWLSSRLRRWAG